MRMGLSKKKEYQILRDILDIGDEGLYVYTFPLKYKIKVEEVFPFIEKYRKWLDYRNGKVKIFAYSRMAVQTAVGWSNISMTDLGEDNIPVVFQGLQISSDDFYIPSKKFFKRLLRQKRSQVN